MATQEPSPKGTQEDRLHQAQEAVEAEAEEDQRLNQLLAERTQLEAEIRTRKLRVGEINLVLNGKDGSTGLTAKVSAARRFQQWLDLEPERAKIRATPEWQAWRGKFMNRNFITDDCGKVTIDWFAMTAGTMLIIFLIIFAGIYNGMPDPVATDESEMISPSRFEIVKSIEFSSGDHPVGYYRYERTIRDKVSGCLYTVLFHLRSDHANIFIQQRNSDGTLTGCGHP